jgi:lysophospholipase L1-like esterase
MADAATSLSYYYLAAIDVEAPADARALVTFGDSITDGTASTPNSNHSWPALLAVRLANNKRTVRSAWPIWGSAAIACSTTDRARARWRASIATC